MALISGSSSTEAERSFALLKRLRSDFRKGLFTHLPFLMRIRMNGLDFNLLNTVYVKL